MALHACRSTYSDAGRFVAATNRKIEAMTDSIERTAILSGDGVYRYRLARRWSDGEQVTFVMLNPSTADHTVDDPTLKKVMKLSRAWGYGGLQVVNLYAFRSPDPRDLWAATDPVGPENNEHLRAAGAEGGLMVAAWGNNAQPERIAEVLAFPGFGELHCLAVNAGGQPKHPLYVRSDAIAVLCPAASFPGA